MMEPIKPDHARVSLYEGMDRVNNLRHALLGVIDEINWATCQKVIIKPNLVKIDRHHAVTHPDALGCVLTMVRERYRGPLMIAEGCAEEPTPELFKRQGFEGLAKEYGALLVDLNEDDGVPFTVYNRRARPLRVRVARQIIEADCRISLCLPKTHDHVVVTLSIKNMIMGSIVNRRLAAHDHALSTWFNGLARIVWGHGNGLGSDKVAMHQGYPMINLNLARTAPFVRPHLSIVDGFFGMDGAGPINGEIVPWRIALAGTDPLAVDCLTSHLMGFEINQIGYLNYCTQLGLGCANLDEIDILGNVSPQNVARTFRSHPDYQRQIQWHHPEAARLLRSDPKKW